MIDREQTFLKLCTFMMCHWEEKSGVDGNLALQEVKTRIKLDLTFEPVI